MDDCADTGVMENEDMKFIILHDDYNDSIIFNVSDIVVVRKIEDNKTEIVLRSKNKSLFVQESVDTIYKVLNEVIR